MKITPTLRLRLLIRAAWDAAHDIMIRVKVREELEKQSGETMEEFARTTGLEYRAIDVDAEIDRHFREAQENIAKRGEGE